MQSHPCEILLVEDNSEDIALLERAFDKAHSVCALLVLKDGEQAISYLAQRVDQGSRFGLPTLIITDLKMPKKNGHELLEWIRSQPMLSGNPVIMLSSSGEKVDIDRAMALGAKSYMQKPVSLTGLEQLVRSILASWGIIKDLSE